MIADILQFAFAGVTIGAVYALVALGFTLIFNSTHIANFAQGDFAMLGAMTTVFAVAGGVPVIAATALGIVVAIAAGLALFRFAVDRARGSSVLGLIVLTIGASIFAKGVAQIVFDKRFHSLPPWLPVGPLHLLGATVQAQSLVVLAGASVIVVALATFTARTLMGKGMIAVSENVLAAKLMGMNVKGVVTLAFAVSAGIGGLAGIMAGPITLTSYDAGTLLSLKGFAAAMLGGMGNPIGAVIGGLVLGLVEAFGSGLLSSAYKDAYAFLIILLVLAVRPQGLFATSGKERV